MFRDHHLNNAIVVVISLWLFVDLLTSLGIRKLHEELSCTITPGSMSLLNCDNYQRGRVSSVVDTQLILLIAYLNHLTTRFNTWCRMS